MATHCASAGDHATPLRFSVVPLVAALHVVPLVECRMVPLPPTTTHCASAGDQATEFNITLVTPLVAALHVVPLVEYRMVPLSPTTTH